MATEPSPSAFPHVVAGGGGRVSRGLRQPHIQWVHRKYVYPRFARRRTQWSRWMHPPRRDSGKRVGEASFPRPVEWVGIRSSPGSLGPEEPLDTGSGEVGGPSGGVPASLRDKMRMGTDWSVGDGCWGGDAVLGDGDGDQCGADTKRQGRGRDWGTRVITGSWDSCQVSSQERPF